MEEVLYLENDQVWELRVEIWVLAWVVLTQVQSNIATNENLQLLSISAMIYFCIQNS